MSNTNNITATLTLTELNQLISDVTAAEKITKAGLRTLSRELLAHVFQHGDVEPINTLLGTDDQGKFRLTPINWRTAVQYFNNFVAFTSNFEKEVQEYAVKGTGTRTPLVFNKKSKAKYERLLPTVQAWLAESANDLWTWSDDIKIEAQAPDFMKNAIQALKNAMDEEKGAFTMQEIMVALIEDENITMSLTDIRESMVLPVADAA